MTVSEKTYIDTAPFIYLIENHPTNYVKVESFLASAVQNGATFATSVVTLAEYGVQPQRIGRLDLIQDFKDLLRNLAFDFLPVTEPVAEIAYRLRAKYPTLRALDALHIAAALDSGCRNFFTNDHPLKQVSELSVILVDEI